MSDHSGRQSAYADDLALIAWKAPDADVRQAASEVLHEASLAVRSLLERTYVEQVLRDTMGPPLSPFVISEEFLPIAVNLVQLSISQEYGASRVRVVSEDTIGVAGGLLILKSGATHYATPDLRARRSKSQCFSMAPGAAAASLALDVGVGAVATIDWDGDGYEIMLDSRFRRRHLPCKIDLLNQHSFIDHPRRTLEQIGLSIDDCGDGGLVIRTGSPESLLQFTAIAAGSATLVLRDAPPEDAKAMWATITLRPLDDMPDDLTLGWGRKALPWAHVPVPVDISAGSSFAEAMVQQFGDATTNAQEST